MQEFTTDNYRRMLLVLPVVVAVLGLASCGLSGSGGGAGSPNESDAIRRTKALLVGIPQHGAALGSPRAPVTLQFFGDLQCRDSRRVMLGALPFLIRHWVRDGKLRIVFRSKETETLPAPEFREQQTAALAAGRQKKMWSFIDLFYREQLPEFTKYADDAFLEGIATQAGVDLGRWSEDREIDGWTRMIESEELLADNKKLRTTPSFLIGATGKKAHPLLHFSFDETTVFDEAIRELL